MRLLALPPPMGALNKHLHVEHFLWENSETGWDTPISIWENICIQTRRKSWAISGTSPSPSTVQYNQKGTPSSQQLPEEWNASTTDMVPQLLWFPWRLCFVSHLALKAKGTGRLWAFLDHREQRGGFKWAFEDFQWQRTPELVQRRD